MESEKGKQVASNKITPDMPEWKDWIEICNYTYWNLTGPLAPIKYHNHIMPFNARLHVGTELYNELMAMVNNVKALRIAIVGPAGTGKTYMGMHIANVLESRKFTIDQVIFSGADYLRLIDTLKPGKCIVLDEPTYSASARNWQDQYQQLVVRTLESSRFLNNPTLVPVVNRNLLDKVIREYYLTHVIEMQGRGIGRVYKTSKSQWNDDLYRNRGPLICAYQPGLELSRCGRDTCLYCPELPACNKYIWPQYERKREAAIAYYRKRDQRELDSNEYKSSGETFKDLCDKAWEIRESLMNDKGEFSIPQVRYTLELNRTDAQMVIKYINEKHKGVTAVTHESPDTA